MKLTPRTPADFAEAQRAFLPPGAAFNWPAGGFGDALLTGMGQELARADAATQGVLDSAIEMHRPIYGNWHISEYRRVAQEVIAGVVEAMPRKPFRAGSKAGDRLWSSAAPNLNFQIPLLKIDHLLGPFRAGSKAGDRLLGPRSGYILRVRYYYSVVNPKPVWDALNAFKQAHVFLWFEDITGVGGSYAPN